MRRREEEERREEEKRREEVEKRGDTRWRGGSGISIGRTHPAAYGRVDPVLAVVTVHTHQPRPPPRHSPRH